jgi:short-subunit dehydrogenase
VNTLVNNAGIGLQGAFGEQEVDAIDRVVALNVTTRSQSIAASVFIQDVARYDLTRRRAAYSPALTDVEWG